MSMSSAGRAENTNGCVTRPKGREIGLRGFAAQIRLCSPTGSYVMATAEHQEPYESRGSRTVLGARGGEILPRDSTKDERLVVSMTSSLSFATSEILGAISLDPQRGRIVVPRARSHHCPGHSRELVGKRDGREFGRPSGQQRGEPGPMLAAVDLGITDDSEGASHEQAAQITVTLFADTAEPVATST